MKPDIKIGLFVFLFFLSIKTRAQNEFYILEGKIVNAQTKLFVNGAIVKFPSLNTEFKSDKDGTFRIALPAGEIISILINHPDYHLKLDVLKVKNDTAITFEMEPLMRSFLIGEVEKTAERYNKVTEPQMGMEKLTSSVIKKLPLMAGEKDVLKSFTYLPGVQSATEGTTELNVRGGSSDQNLYLLDNSSLYKSSHLLGMLSTFQALTADEIDFYKGDFPARYGGRLSSVIDVKTKQPGNQSLQLEGEIGLISGKMLAEVPVIKGKSALMAAVRGTYIDKIARMFADKNNFESFNFYDTQVKWHHKFNEKNQITVNYFADCDTYYFYEKTGKQNDIFTLDKQIWQNRVFSADCRLKLNEKLETRFFIGSTQYEMNLNEKHENPDSTLIYFNEFTSTIHD
ncbi:MAG: TonB-dependent receptor plug domain-containing protein, partial [Mariniphaga sp.]